MILREPVKFDELLGVCKFKYYDEMVKAVVDIERELIAVNGHMHADLEEMLLDDESRQQDLWGINLHPDGEEIEFDSLINIRPGQNNRSRGIENPEVAQKVVEVTKKWIIHSHIPN